MRRPTALAFASKSLLPLCAASPAWSQTPPAPAAVAPDSRGSVPPTRPQPGPSLHVEAAPAASPEVPPERHPVVAPANYPAVAPSRVRHSFTGGQVFGLFAVGGIAGITGGLLGAVLGILPAALDSGEGFWMVTYFGYSLVAGLGVGTFGSMSHWGGDGITSFVGALVGASVGYGLQFGLLDPSDTPPWGSAMVITALLSTTGAVGGYLLSAALGGGSDVIARSGARTRLVATAQPLHGGLVLGLGGSF